MKRGPIVSLADHGIPEEDVRSEHLEAIYWHRLRVDRSPVSAKPRMTLVPPPAKGQV